MAPRRSRTATVAITLPWALITLAVLVLAAILVVTARLSLTGSDGEARPLATAPPVFGPPSDPPAVPSTAAADEGTARPSPAPSRSPSRPASPSRRSPSPRATTPAGTSANGCTVVSVNGVTTTTCDRPGCRVRTRPAGVSVSCSGRSAKSSRTRDR